MNKTLRRAGNAILLDLLIQCSSEEIAFFNRMYYHKKLGMRLSDMVIGLSDDKLSHAITQCENTLAKKKNK